MKSTFEEYQGWVNSPTWDLFTFLTEEDVTRKRLVGLVHQAPEEEKQVEALRTWFSTQMDEFLKGYTSNSRYRVAVKSLIGHWVTDPMRHIDWLVVYDVLQGEVALPQEPLVQTVIEVLKQTDWQSIATSGNGGADEALRSWSADQCLVWVENQESRRHPGPLAALPQTLLSHYSQAVVWEDVARALRRE